MKRLWKLAALLLVVALVAAACGDDDTEETTTTTTQAPDTTPGEEPTTTAPPTTSDEPFRIAFVSPSAVNDLAFSQSIFDAVSAVQSEMGDGAIEFVYTDGTFVVEDAAAAIRDYASEGYDLVIAHGSQYGGSLQEIAPDFPNTSFAWGTAADTFGLPNVYAYEAASHEGGFVMGRMAAALSESNTIGIVGPVEVGDAKLYVDGFANGVKAEKAEANVAINYIGSFSDVALASEAAQAHISAGADVLSGTAQMTVGAIGVASDQGAFWFGTQANQAQLAPEIVVASQVYKWEVILGPMIDNIKNGVLGGEIYEINLANGGEVIEFNDAFDLRADIRELGENTVANIISGSVEVPREFDPDQQTPAGPFRIAFVSPSAVNDLAFSQSIFDAVSAVQSEMGDGAIEFVYTDGTFVVEDAAAAIRDYASEGYDLVIAHGSQYGGSLQEIAPDFPDTSFAWGTAGDTFGLPNVYAYEAASHEGGFVMGRMAAALSESNTIGIVGPVEVGDAKLYVDGFAAGVNDQNPNANVAINYIGSFSDVALASEAAQAHISAGADVLSGTAQMTVGAIGVASDQGAFWFGTQANQAQLAPEIVVASQVYKWEVILGPMIDNIKNGVLGGEAYEINLANGGEIIEYNASYPLSAEIQQLAVDTIAGIIDGSIVVPTE